MANEIQIIHDDAAEAIYAVLRDVAGQFYAGASAEAFESANWATYDIALAQVDASSPPAAGNAAYQGTFPAVAAGFYWLDFYVRAGGSPAQTDWLAKSILYYWDATSLTPSRHVPSASASTASGLYVKPGSTDVSIYFLLKDAATGQPYTTSGDEASLNLIHQTSGAAQVSNDVTAALDAADSTHADNKVFHCGSGIWRCDFVDAAFASGVERAMLLVTHDDGDVIPAAVVVELWAAKALCAALAVLAGNMTFDEATGQANFLDAEDATTKRASYTVSPVSVGRSDASIA